MQKGIKSRLIIHEILKLIKIRSFDFDKAFIISTKGIDLIESDKRLFTIGRLDRDTTGLLLITNNGDLSYKLTHPKFEIERRYYVVSAIDIDIDSCLKLKKGVRLEDGTYANAHLKRLYKEKNKIYWDISLNEGKNREIKKIFSFFASR